MQHFLHFDEIKHLTIQELIDKLDLSVKISIGDIKLTDLIFNNQSSTGVYILYTSGNTPFYVGKTGSRAILERIAGHLDLRPDAYMNNLLYALVGKKKGGKHPHANYDDMVSAYELSLNYKLVIISMMSSNQEEKAKILRLEGILRHYLVKAHNFKKQKLPQELHTIVANL